MHRKSVRPGGVSLHDTEQLGVSITLYEQNSGPHPCVALHGAPTHAASSCFPHALASDIPAPHTVHRTHVPLEFPPHPWL